RRVPAEGSAGGKGLRAPDALRGAPEPHVPPRIPPAARAASAAAQGSAPGGGSGGGRTGREGFSKTGNCKTNFGGNGGRGERAHHGDHAGACASVPGGGKRRKLWSERGNCETNFGAWRGTAGRLG